MVFTSGNSPIDIALTGLSNNGVATLALTRALEIGRGGAALAAASTLASAVESSTSTGIQVTGGDEGSAKGMVNTRFWNLSNEARAVLCMAIAMSFHYLGYSFARPTTLSLFTSEKTGYGGSPAAFPFAMAFVSPAALLWLIAYGRVLDAHGPHRTLTRTTAFCGSVLIGSALLVRFLQDSDISLFSIPLVKFVVGPLFVFRESYVALLTSQYWSFMSSVFNPSQSARWFAPISGLTSVTSALAGLGVSRLVNAVGIPGALIGTGLMLFLTLIFTNAAYSIAEKGGFNPEEEILKKKASKKDKTLESKEKENMVKKASALFQRVPVLGALFAEILSSQALATLLNVCFVTKLSSSIPNDAERAGWMGKFFATINIIAMTLQFVVLPPLMTVIEARDLWRVLPLIMVFMTTFQSLKPDPSLYIVSGSLLAMKALEYSARRMLDEMVYVPLDYESRYLGKEVIGVFGYRFGKSLMSLGLTALTSTFGDLGLQELSYLVNGANLVWLTTSWRLSNLVPTKKEANEKYAKKKQ